ncbi:hypothetical protein [Lunatimonas salinarum]|nr:hypothetical protein [Lunatimonas salinarum]
MKNRDIKELWVLDRVVGTWFGYGNDPELSLVFKPIFIYQRYGGCQI